MNIRSVIPLVAATLLAIVPALSAQAADRAKLRAFLEITGFDVAITSMQQGAMAGPGMAGAAPDEFGAQWVRLAEKIFDPDEMLNRSLDMLEAVMPDDLVDHGAAFYASDLGQRLVAVENESHMVASAVKDAEAARILDALSSEGSARIDQYRAMNNAIGGVESNLRAVIEIQVRYLMAAMNAGSVDFEMSEADLRGIFQSQAPQLRQGIEINGIMGGAYAYRDISDADVTAYVAALENPKMRQVYEILNAVQFEIMAERYERLATALADLSPQQDI